MADKYELSAETRKGLGKADSRRMRRVANQIPAIIYGAGKTPTPILINHHQMDNALKNDAFYSHILTVRVGSTEEKVVLKALQRHPSRPQILHADFLRISASEKLHMNVPIRFINEEVAPGVKEDHGLVSHLLNDVEIRCLPSDLPEFIEADLSELGMDQSFHLSQLKVPHGVEIVALLHEDDRPVASIHKPHMEETEEQAAAPSAEVPLVGEEGEGAEEQPKEGEE